jgi:hypothetical protein
MSSPTQRAGREERRKQIEALGGFGHNTQSMLIEASDLLEAGGPENRQKSFKICEELLAFPQLGDLHMAGCHSILACGNDEFVQV